jgi:hypothetical protein
MARSSDFESILSARVEEFVNDITNLARRHAVETLSRALDGDGIGRVAGGRGKSAAMSGGNGRGRRSSDDVEEQAGLLLAFIGKNPGLRAEEISSEVGLSTKVLALPMRKLSAAKKVRTEGQKRATRYFLTGGAGGSGKGKGGPGKRKAKAGGRKKRAGGRGQRKSVNGAAAAAGGETAAA